MLMDERPLPASSERLNEREAVIAQLPTLLPKEREEDKGRGGSEGAGIGWRASNRRCVEVGEDVRVRSRP